MDRKRVIHNAKSRQSGQRKKGKKRQKSKTAEEHDPNAPIIVPKSEEQKELDRREKLRLELIAQSESKINSKKKRRLEKYIDKKLKQEERVVLFEKLTKSQAQLPNALGLASSATLGTGKVTTHQARLDKEEHHEVERTMNGRARSGKRKRSAVTYDSAGEDDDMSDKDFEMKDVTSYAENEEDEAAVPGSSRTNPVVVIDSGFSTAVEMPAPATTTIGGALQRNPDGTIIAPRIAKKKRNKGTTSASWKVRAGQAAAGGDDSDTSFDSSDSDNDTDEHVEHTQEAHSDDDAHSEENQGEGDSDSDGSGEDGEGSEETSKPTRKKLGFKDWAMKQLNAAKGYDAPVDAATPQPDALPEPAPPAPKKRKLDPSEPRGPLGEVLQLPQTALAQHLQEQGNTVIGQAIKRKSVDVKRPPDVDAARLLLPIVAEEQPIMEAILLNNVVIICGETGSGKTTQVPQFLYEAGFGSPGSDNPGMIGVTQPRRVAAMSMASRVAHELSLSSSKVSYQIRYDATVSSNTSIKFMTDGVLLRELATDFLLTKYSVIIIDEAHERSMNTDVLIGVLSRVIKLREDMWVQRKDNIKPLRLVIMSATLRVSDFAENTTLFAKPPPIITVPGRSHPVTVHFSRRTASDYVTEAIRKASKIHARLPPGGVIIFLTGQNEISGVCKKLEARYGAKALQERKRRRTAPPGQSTSTFAELEQRNTVAPAQADVEAEDVDLGAEQELALDVDGNDADLDEDEDALDSDEDMDDAELGIDKEESEVPMHIVPLYALLPSEKQMKVFEPPPPGTRLVVVSTNVAETSLTIPGIRYVVDCGRAKERRYDVTNGVQAFQVSWTSKASAAQRAGRAGRTGPGHCYRLYSSALYETYFEEFSQPEILRMPIEGVALQMKSMHIDAVVNFPFPTPPDRLSLKKAEDILTHLGALTTPQSGTSLGGKITEIGRAMSLFPLSPRFSRMLVSGRQHGSLPYVVAIVSALSVGDPFLREETITEGDAADEDSETEDLSHLTSEAVRAKEIHRLRRKAFFQSQETHASLGDHISDVFRILSVVGAYEYAGGGHKFCSEHFVRPKAMEEIHKLRAQISSIVQTNFPDASAGFVSNLLPPSALQLKVLRQLLTAGFIDQVAVRKDKVLKDAATGQQFTTSRGVPYRAIGVDEDVYIHPSSVLAGRPPPDFVVYLEVVRTSKVWIKGVTTINATWLSSLGKTMCTYSKPIRTMDGKSVVIPHFGPAGWELGPIPAPS